MRCGFARRQLPKGSDGWLNLARQSCTIVCGIDKRNRE
jgi:hypothetical protein